MAGAADDDLPPNPYVDPSAVKKASSSDDETPVPAGFAPPVLSTEAEAEAEGTGDSSGGSARGLCG